MICLPDLRVPLDDVAATGFSPQPPDQQRIPCFFVLKRGFRTIRRTTTGAAADPTAEKCHFIPACGVQFPVRSLPILSSHPPSLHRSDSASSQSPNSQIPVPIPRLQSPASFQNASESLVYIFQKGSSGLGTGGCVQCEHRRQGKRDVAREGCKRCF